VFASWSVSLLQCVLVVRYAGTTTENAVDLRNNLRRSATVALYVAVLEMTIDCIDNSDD